jgi:hypothetical protein
LGFGGIGVGIPWEVISLSERYANALMKALASINLSSLVESGDFLSIIPEPYVSLILVFDYCFGWDYGGFGAAGGGKVGFGD